MSDIIVSLKNYSFLKIDCEIGILYELKEHFTFFVDNYKHMPKYKERLWDGTVSLLDCRFGTLPVGLFPDLLKYATESLGYEVECVDSPYGMPDEEADVTLEDVTEFVESLNIHSKGKKLEIRDYQINAVYNCIRNVRQVSLTPTGGGKSFIAYCLYRWYMEQGLERFLLVVPNLSLVKQMYADFADYSSHNGYDVAKNTQVVCDGQPKQLKKSLVIATWQSIHRQPSKWFNDGVDVILMDEVHMAKADCVKGIFEKATEVKYRIGVTGSLDKSVTNKLVIKGNIGQISREKSTRDLINEGYLSNLKIGCVVLKYSKETKKMYVDEKFKYRDEVDFLCAHVGRNKFIRKLALSQSGNTLVLFNYVEKHGEPLYEEILKHAGEKKVHFISGKVEADDREQIRQLVQGSQEDNIIVASVGTFSTGINLPRIHNIIFASPTKSVIRVIQSIGRGLRKSDDKTHLMLFDIADLIKPSKVKPNTTFSHFVERLRIYNEEQHTYKIVEVNIE